MSALLLSVAIFVVWLVVGRALISWLVPQREGVEVLLGAPAAGMGVTVLTVFWLSRTGLGVVRFAPFLLAALLLLSSAWLLWRRPSWRGYLPFAGLLAAAAPLTGWPLLVHGFEWLSFVNDDMANYALLAQRLLNHGFFDVPSNDDMFGGRHLNTIFWVHCLVERPGSDLILSLTSALTGLPAPRVFMPLMLALHLTLLSGSAAVIHGACHQLKVTLVATVLLALSPLVSLGTLYQLMGQMTGLGMLMGSLTFLTTVPENTSRWREALFLSIIISAQLVFYPEVLPILAVILAVWMLLNRPAAKRLAGIALRAAPILVLFLGRYLAMVYTFLLHQVKHGTEGASVNTEIFPNYRVPSGLAELWGLQRMAARPNEPWLSLGIALGIALLAFTVWKAVRRTRTMNVVHIGVVCMLAMAAFLFARGSGFGLYKTAMYIQPFLWGALVMGLLEHGRARLARGAGIVALAVLCGRTQWGYVSRSGGAGERTAGPFVEVAGATSSSILSEFESLVRANPAKRFVLDTSNVVLAKLQAYFLDGIPSSFPFLDLYQPVGKHLTIAQAPALMGEQAKLRAAWAARHRDGAFWFPDGNGGGESSPFSMDSDGQPTSTADSAEYSLVMSTSRHTFLNRRNVTGELANFSILPWNQVSHHLIFIESLLGRSYYSLDREHASYYQLEPDYFFGKRTMAGFGRRAVFQAINPTPGARMVIEISSSLKGDGENLLPPVAAVGRDRAPFNVVGRGSARLVSPPLEAQEIHGRPFLGLDMGADGVTFKNVRTGLMRLYGSGIPDDSRRLTCFCRDISLISSQAYDTMDAPAALDTFPDGLANRNLEYSGVFEDGWLSEHSSFVLSAPQADKTTFVLKGEIPLIKDATFTTSCKLLIDGSTMVEQPLGLGSFVIEAPATPGRHQVELLFSRAQSLSGSDGRPVTARVRELGFKDR